MKSGSWPSIVAIYLYGVLGSASLSKVIPLQQDLTTHLGASPAQFALLISLLTIAPAALATVGGSLIDRVGAHRALVAAALLGATLNLAYLFAPSLFAFQVLRVLEGGVIVGAYSAAPGLIMATTAPERRSSAMAFWSTYTPVGVSLGLALSSLFAGTEFWRGGYLVHGSLWLAMAVAGTWLPRPPRAAHPNATRPSLLAAYAQPGPLRVAATFAALVVMGFGVNTVFPAWYSQSHGITLAEASRLLAVANLVMILGSFTLLFLLARGVAPFRLFLVLAAVSTTVLALLFAEGQHEGVLIASLVIWQIANGGAIAVATASLPRVIASPSQGAAAAGLLSQLAALATFLTPPLWLWALGTHRSTTFVVIVACAWLVALTLLPRGASRIPASTKAL